MEDKPSSKMDMSQVQAINKVKYQLPSNLNIVERRTNKVNFADQNQYSSQSGNELVIRLQASSDYVYGKNCYLVFDVEALGVDDNDTGTDFFGFNKGTAMSLFDRVLYEDRSGSELERNDALNRWVRQVQPLHWSTEYTTTGVANAGEFQSSYPADPTATPPVYLPNGSLANYNIRSTTVPAVSNKLTCVIPLHWFMGVFNQETLIPSMLVSGSLIRLQLARATDAIVRIAGATTEVASYSITNPRVVLDSLSLAPVVQKNLMEQSQAGGGLDFCYETAYYQSGNPGSQQNFNLQVNKAVSRCQRLYWSAHAQATPSSAAKDNLGTGQLNVSSLDYRLGDLYFPQRVINVTGSPQKNGAELYENTLQSIHRMKCSIDPPSVSKNSFCNDGTPLNATAGDNNNDGRAVHCQSFEMSSALEYSGLAINNSRTLEARINFVGTPATDQVIDAWICYLKLAKCNQLRAVIKE